MIILTILIVWLAGAVAYLYISKNKQKYSTINSYSWLINKGSETLESAQQKLAEERNNSIKAVYSIQKDEESTFFDLTKIGTFR